VAGPFRVAQEGILLATTSRAALLADLRELHARREAQRETLVRALIAVDTTSERIDVLLLRLAHHAGR
jgi:hypothetical protein